jgi:outer membrane immunogenic protein
MALHYAVAGACVVAFISTPIAAADLGGVTPTSLRFDGTAPAPIWTGLYIGADGGFSFASGATANGFVGGLHVGYNYQLGHWVFGIETDLTYDSFLTSSVTSAVSPGWVGTLRPRLGYAMGPLLLYGTGGLAYGNPALFSMTGDSRLGWVAGAGVEYALSKNMSLRLEYLHSDLGASTNAADHLTDNVIRLGINFRF